MAKPKEGDKRGWVKSRVNPKGKVEGASGYRYEKGRWVQYRGGKRVGPFKGRGGITGNVDIVGGTRSAIGKGVKGALKVITRSDYPDDFTFEKAKEIRKKRLAKQKSETEAREKTDEYIKGDKDKDKKKDSPKADKPEAGGKTEPTKVERSEKARWIEKTRNSPAAQSGAFTDDERWALQKRHRAWKEARKKKKR